MSNNLAVKSGDDLTEVFKEIFGDCVTEINEASKEASKTVAAECVKRLKSTSPRSKGHTKYAKSWKSKKIDDGYVVYSDMPGLTHLLEHGHDIIKNGVKVGRTKAQPHIKPVEEEGKALFIDEVTKEVNKRLSQ